MNKIPVFNGLATTAVFTRKTGKVENKIPDDSSVIKKTDYNAKI